MTVASFAENTFSHSATIRTKQAHKCPDIMFTGSLRVSFTRSIYIYLFIFFTKYSHQINIPRIGLQAGHSQHDTTCETCECSQMVFLILCFYFFFFASFFVLRRIGSGKHRLYLFVFIFYLEKFIFFFPSLKLSIDRQNSSPVRNFRT